MSGVYTMLMLGDFQFGIDTAAYQEFRRSTEYHWPSQSRFANTPVLQYTGKGDETISLPGTIFPEWNGGTGQLDDLRDIADQKQPLLMIDGRGNVMGKWVIERVEEDQSNFAQAGVARRQNFTLSLKKYGDIDVADLPAALLGVEFPPPIPGVVTSMPEVSATLSSSSSATDMLKAVSLTANAALSSASRLGTNLTTALDNVARVASSLGIHAPAITQALTRSMDVVNGIRTTSNDGLKLMGRVQTAASAASVARSMFADSARLGQLAGGSSASITTSVAELTASGAPTDALDAATGALVSANKVTALSSSLTDNTNTILQKIGP